MQSTCITSAYRRPYDPTLKGIGAGQLRLFTCEPKLASCQLLANIMSKTMLVLCNCFLLFTSGTAITTTDPVLGRQSKEPVIAGAVDFTYQIFMDPGCEKFAADNDTKQRCEDIYERYVYTTMAESCTGPVQTTQKREPITLTIFADLT